MFARITSGGKNNIHNVVLNIDGTYKSIDPINKRLLKHRIIMLHGEVDDEMAASVTLQLEYPAEKSAEVIFLYMNSPGGSVSAGMDIVDTM